MSRQKTYHTAFASADAKLCEAFFDKLSGRESARIFLIVCNTMYAWYVYGPNLRTTGLVRGVEIEYLHVLRICVLFEAVLNMGRDHYCHLGADPEFLTVNIKCTGAT